MSTPLDMLRRVLREREVALPVLTEEELYACDPELEPSERIAPLLSLTELGEEELVAAEQRGQQSLVERGLAAYSGSVFSLDGLLHGLTMARIAPSFAVIADRDFNAAVSTLYFYGLADAGAIIESTSADMDVHEFTACRLETAATVLVELIDPAERAKADGDLILVEGDRDDPAWSAMEADLQKADCVTRVYAALPTVDGVRDINVSFAAVRGGLWMIGGYETPTEQRRSARQASRKTLFAICDDLLGSSNHASS